MKDINDSFGHRSATTCCGVSLVRCRRMCVAATRSRAWAVTSSSSSSTGSTRPTPHRRSPNVCATRCVGTPIEADAEALAVTASFGLAVGTPEDLPPMLLQRADAAMYRAKAIGGAEVVVFEDVADLNVTTLADELAVAVSHGLIQPHVQSIVDLNRGVLVGYQGLARWEHPQTRAPRSRVSSSTYVGEHADPAGRRPRRAPAHRGGRGPNLPQRRARTRVRASLPTADRRRRLRRATSSRSSTISGSRSSDLCVEIAHALIARPSRTSRRHASRSARYRHSDRAERRSTANARSITSSSTDSTSFASPARLVHDAEHDPTRSRVAHGTITLARALGLTVIAVGIETEPQRIDMRDAGCDYGQGNLFGPVQPAGEID